MRYTQNLRLPIFDEPEFDLFNVADFNTGNQNVENKFIEIDNGYKTTQNELNNKNSTLNADETRREAKEQERITAEKARTAAENIRSSKEATRETEEQKRISAEQQRISTETSRIAAESQRTNAESQRIESESQRVLKEETRILNEDKRIVAEKERDKKITDITNKITTVENNVNTLSGKVTTVENNVNTLSGKVTITENQIIQLLKRVEKLENGGVTPNIPIKTITLNANNHTFKIDDTFKLIATITPDNATNKEIMWSANNNNVSVENGTVTALKVGNSIVSCTSLEDSNKKATCNFIVEAKDIIGADWIIENIPNITGNENAWTDFEYFTSKPITVTKTEVSYDNGESWRELTMYEDHSGNNQRMYGYIMVYPGIKTCKIRVTDNNKNTVLSNSFTTTSKAQEQIPVKSISLNATNQTLKVNNTFKLIETVLPENATNKNVTWETNNNNVTVVNGLVTGKTVGSSIITVKSNENSNIKTECNFTIEEAGGVADWAIENIRDITGFANSWSICEYFITKNIKITKTDISYNNGETWNETNLIQSEDNPLRIFGSLRMGSEEQTCILKGIDINGNSVLSNTFKLTPM